MQCKAAMAFPSPSSPGSLSPSTVIVGATLQPPPKSYHSISMFGTLFSGPVQTHPCPESDISCVVFIAESSSELELSLGAPTSCRLREEAGPKGHCLMHRKVPSKSLFHTKAFLLSRFVSTYCVR